MTDEPSSAEPVRPVTSRLFWAVLAILIALLLAGSWMLARSIDQFKKAGPAPPVLGTPDLAFTAVERSGAERSLSELGGRAVVLAYAYSRCARGCYGVAGQMLKLRDHFAGDSRVHFVSVAVWPQVDTPTMLAAYAEQLGVRADDPWWWLSGSREETWRWMSREMGFEPTSEIPVEERLNPEDVVAHDLRAVLLDPSGRVRGYYQLMHPQAEAAEMSLEKLKRDIAVVLEEPG